MTDRRIENTVFNAKSEDGTGPKNLYFCNEFRFESFYNGRPLSIWEMKNQHVSGRIAELLCDFNFSPGVQSSIKEFNPVDPKKLQVH